MVTEYYIRIDIHIILKLLLASMIFFYVKLNHTPISYLIMLYFQPGTSNILNTGIVLFSRYITQL